MRIRCYVPRFRPAPALTGSGSAVSAFTSRTCSIMSEKATRTNVTATFACFSMTAAPLGHPASRSRCFVIVPRVQSRSAGLEPVTPWLSPRVPRAQTGATGANAGKGNNNCRDGKEARPGHSRLLTGIESIAPGRIVTEPPQRTKLNLWAPGTPHRANDSGTRGSKPERLRRAADSGASLFGALSKQGCSILST
jgi:hypothetical protein